MQLSAELSDAKKRISLLSEYLTSCGNMLQKLTQNEKQNGKRETKNYSVQLENHPSRLLSVEQVAGFIGVSVKTVRRYHNAHLLPEPIRLCGKLLLKWRLGDIAEFVDRQYKG